MRARAQLLLLGLARALFYRMQVRAQISPTMMARVARMSTPEVRRAGFGHALRPARAQLDEGGLPSPPHLKLAEAAAAIESVFNDISDSEDVMPELVCTSLAACV